MSNGPHELDQPSLESPTPGAEESCSVEAERCTPCGASGRWRKLFLLVAVLVLLACEIKELRARGAAQAAFDRLNAAIGKEKDLQHLKRDEVHQVVGRDPDEYDRGRGLEVYRWTNGLKPHALYVKYLLVNLTLYANDFAFDEEPGS